MRLFLLRLVTICLFISAPALFSAQNLTINKDVETFINELSKQYGFKKQDLLSIFKQTKYKADIIASMERPYEKKNWDVYKNLFLTDGRLVNGIRFWQKNQKTLARAEKKYQVPASIIVAIIGVETRYGKHTGTHRVIDALSTLAFHYPKRSAFFRKELKEFFLLCRENDFNPLEMYGSYAGAIGKPQFMPSSYRYYAVDFSGNGKSDLLNNNEDVIGSVANYLHQHGWHFNQAVAEPVRVSGKIQKNMSLNSKQANYKVKTLIKEGFKPLNANPPLPEKAGIIELVRANDNEYWMAFPNFYVITRYNTSPQYAMAVYLLSQALDKQWQMAHVVHHHAYA